ncbi:uncharacterized protein LOC111451849 [Cucurbita moschata]|uniref:Uncharacterized protein LOC111451849 n=1 Tax=Cucurbita moschata TaxID=3662 RepID=A0A6J1G972_CUCMO|nr:uncharacterized protein LOC111451849 [Cucurbita moschata]
MGLLQLYGGSYFVVSVVVVRAWGTFFVVGVVGMVGMVGVVGVAWRSYMMVTAMMSWCNNRVAVRFNRFDDIDLRLRRQVVVVVMRAWSSHMMVAMMVVVVRAWSTYMMVAMAVVVRA